MSDTTILTPAMCLMGWTLQFSFPSAASIKAGAQQQVTADDFKYGDSRCDRRSESSE